MLPLATTLLLALTLLQETSREATTLEIQDGIFTGKVAQAQHLGTGILGPWIFPDLTDQSFCLFMSVAALLSIQSMELSLGEPLLALAQID